MNQLNILFKILIATYFVIFVFSKEQSENDSKLCDNGQVISMDHWCNGKVDCTDGSDETTACLKVNCRKFSFRCLYGACIDFFLKCNNVTDCYDGSDETALVCSGIQLNSKCSTFEVECNNLQCIPEESVCDGKLDCTDGSDETINTCANRPCAKNYFRCGYGAYGPCIKKLAKCDNKIDCADRSDENNDECQEEKLVDSEQTPSTDPIKLNPITIEPSILIGCNVPNETLILTELNTNKDIKSGTVVPSLTAVNYSCPLKHILDGNIHNFCAKDWVFPHPKCIKLCPPITDHTIQAYCSLNGEEIDCKEYVQPRTTARISCAVLYKKPEGVFHEDLYCQDNGEWNYLPLKCEQICGTTNIKVPFIENSVIEEVPWHAGIYEKRENGKYYNICGGTIYSSKIVISAAHCFWDSKLSKLFDKSKFLVVVGKVNRDYYADENLDVQESNVSKIDYPITFSGANYGYANDIAVLTLNDHIEFKNHIRPACLTWRQLNEQFLQSNKHGIVAGWGIADDGNHRAELRFVELVSIHSYTCKRLITKSGKIAGDKFCLQGNNGKNVCRGDDGGGFVIPEEIGNTTYHLWGVASNGITSSKDGVVKCGKNLVTFFTNVQYYKQLINDAYYKAYMLN